MNTLKNTNNIILMLLATHLLYTNSMLLSGLNNVHIVLIVFFAASYSILTAIILNKIPSVFLFTIAAILDGFGVYAEYSAYVSKEMIAVYFGIYTSLIVIAIGSLKMLAEAKEKKDLELAILKGKNSELTRSLKKLEDEKTELTNSLTEVVESWNEKLKFGASKQPKNLEIIESNLSLLKACKS